MREQVTAFQVTHNGATVSAQRVGPNWQFTWPGSRDRKEQAPVWCSYERAVTIAHHLAEQVAELAPLRAEIERRRDDIAEWLQQQGEAE